LEVKERLLADRERLLAAEVRNKFGTALAEILKLGFSEDLINTADRGFRLVAAKVKEGRTAPLEENILLVEVNRIRSMRETNEGKVENEASYCGLMRTWVWKFPQPSDINRNCWRNVKKRFDALHRKFPNNAGKAC